MKRLLFMLSAYALLLNSEVMAFNAPDSVNVQPFGKVYTYRQSDLPSNVTILISGEGGWNSGMINFAGTFSEMNTLVIGVDVVRYFKELRQRTEDCYNLEADFVKLATEVEKMYKFPDYIPPVIMGYSSGATLVYGILAQAREGTFAGGISLGFCPDLELPKRLCNFNGLTQTVIKEGKSYAFQPDAKLTNHWIVIHGKLDRTCPISSVEDFVKKTSDAELIGLVTVGHTFTRLSDFMPQWKSSYSKLVELNRKADVTAVSKEEVKGLPLVITAAKVQNPDAPVAFLLSGDGGWYGFEQSIADHLAQDGIPTVGLDSKKYFWNRRSPEETAAAVTKSLKYYSMEWGRKRFLLIGYSLGAEIVPFITNRLPEDIKSKSSIVLLSPEPMTDFEIHVSNMIGIGNRKNTYDVTAEIKKMLPLPVLIIFGEGEKPELQPLLKGTSVKISRIPGDHHYKFNLPLIVQTMKENKAF